MALNEKQNWKETVVCPQCRAQMETKLNERQKI